MGVRNGAVSERNTGKQGRLNLSQSAQGADPAVTDETGKNIGFEMMKEMIEGGGRFTFTALGGSMMPLISPGSRLTVEKPGDTLAPGDILLYHEDEDVRAHRLDRIKNAGGKIIYIFRGDALSKKEEIESEKVIGRITACETGGAKINLNASFETSELRILLIFTSVFGKTNRIINALSPLLPLPARRMFAPGKTMYEKISKSLIRHLY